MGHNSKHTVNKTMKELCLFVSESRGRRPTNPLTLEAIGPVMAESLQRYLPDNHLGELQLVWEKPIKNVVWVLPFSVTRWTQGFPSPASA